MDRSCTAADPTHMQVHSKSSIGSLDPGPGLLSQLQRALTPSRWKHRQEGFQSLGPEEPEVNTLGSDILAHHPQGDWPSLQPAGFHRCLLHVLTTPLQAASFAFA